MPSVPPKSRAQIASEYHISTITLRRYLRRHKLLIPNGSILPAYQKLIYHTLGWPSDVDPIIYQRIPLPNKDADL